MNWFKKYSWKIFLWTIAISCFIYLGYKIYNQRVELSSFPEYITSFKEKLLLLLVFFLVFVNWTTEALKWKIGLSSIERITLFQSIKSVLSGLAVSMLGPNRTGEFIGRVVFLKNDNRIKGSMVSIHLSFAQTITTVIIGSFSFAGIYNELFSFSISKIIWIIIAIITSVIATILYFRFDVFIRFLKIFFRKNSSYNLDINDYKSKFSVLLLNLLLSFFRYGIFISQYIILLYILNISENWVLLFQAVSVIYLLMTIIPSFTLAELGIRGTVSVFVLGSLGFAEIPVIMATTVLWFFNIAFPAATGAGFIIRKK